MGGGGLLYRFYSTFSELSIRSYVRSTSFVPPWAPMMPVRGSTASSPPSINQMFHNSAAGIIMKTSPPTTITPIPQRLLLLVRILYITTFSFIHLWPSTASLRPCQVLFTFPLQRVASDPPPLSASLLPLTISAPWGVEHSATLLPSSRTLSRLTSITLNHSSSLNSKLNNKPSMNWQLNLLQCQKVRVWRWQNLDFYHIQKNLRWGGCWWIMACSSVWEHLVYHAFHISVICLLYLWELEKFELISSAIISELGCFDITLSFPKL